MPPRRTPCCADCGVTLVVALGYAPTDIATTATTAEVVQALTGA